MNALSVIVSAVLLVVGCGQHVTERPEAAPASPPPSEPATVTAADASIVDAGAPPVDASVAAPVVDEPPPHVKVATIGMHVGGGPYDDATKEPLRRSVEPHFADLARCWKHVEDPHETDVGVDLVVEAVGGRAKVSHPRTTLKNEPFVACVVTFFEGIDFLKPKTGRTVVSYSVRFKPVK
jgi:hypothetical protein